MGACTTLYVSRQQALITVMGCLHQCSNEKLEDLLYATFGESHLYNFTIGHDDRDDQTLRNITCGR